MEKSIKNRICLATFLWLLMAADLVSQAPPVTSIGSATFSAGTYSVPVLVSGFQDVGNISMTLRYDNTKLVFAGVTLNAGLLTANPVTTPLTDQSGVFRLSCTSASAIALEVPSGTLFTVAFTVKPGIQGVHTLVTWSTVQGDCDITPPVPGVFVPVITNQNMSSFFSNGFVDIAPVPVITGPGSVCPGSTGNLYSTSSGMTGYTWNIPAGGTITTGDGTSSIEVEWTSSGIHTVSVTYTDPVSGPAHTPTVYQVEVLATCDKTLNITLFLESLYSGGGTMRKAQGSSGDQFTGNTADIISVELHDAVNYATIVYTASNINLSTTGQASVLIPAIYNGSYYLTIRHRNSIPTVSALPVSFISGTVNYDFSTSTSQAFGNNLFNIGGVFVIYGGDIRQDGFVGVADMGNVDNMSAAFGSGYLCEDVNGDGFVGVTDMGIIDNNSTKFVSVITP